MAFLNSDAGCIRLTVGLLAFSLCEPEKIIILVFMPETVDHPPGTNLPQVAVQMCDGACSLQCAWYAGMRRSVCTRVWRQHD